MSRHSLYFVLVVASSVACGDTASPVDASAAEVASHDAVADQPDASPDVTSPDVTSPDVTSDVVRDATLDVARDAGPDVTADAGRDATPDAASDVVVDAPRDAATMDAPRDAMQSCSGDAPLCASGTPGGTCGDVVTPAMCTDGAWRCAAGQVLLSECRCAGRPPGSACTCGSTGWVCPDAGADTGADAAGDGSVGTLCGSDRECGSGLLCCYPCGIPGCMNRCSVPVGGRCPLLP